MKRTSLLLAALMIALAGAPAHGQQKDYLTPEEVEKVRDTQEPNERIQLFLKFAAERLLGFEMALTPAAGEEPTRPDVLRDLLNDFIRAVDDTADNLERPLERGGMDLSKTRGRVAQQGAALLKRLEHIRQTYEVAQSEDLRFDLEDAVEAVEALLELGKKIPDGPIPLKALAEEPSEREAPPGKPTLKRRPEKPKDPKPN